jgi:integrase
MKELSVDFSKLRKWEPLSSAPSTFLTSWIMKVLRGIGEITPKSEQLDKIEAVAKSNSMRDYFLIALMGRRGLRVSEALQANRERLQDRGLLLTQKGGIQVNKVLPSSLYAELVEYSKDFPKYELIIPVTRRQAYNLCLKYAKLAGMDNWQRIHPHRFRHYFGTFHARRTGRDPWKVSSLMGHKDLRATKVYVEELSPEEQAEELG